MRALPQAYEKPAIRPKKALFLNDFRCKTSLKRLLKAVPIMDDFCTFYLCAKSRVLQTS